MYIGSTDSRGVNHLANEIIDNATDEGVGGHAEHVAVILHADGSVQVDDDGRGIPTDINAKSGLNGVELVLTRLHAGGKFGGSGYKTSGGLHGVGASAVNALSLRFDVTVKRDGKVHELSFRRGVPGVFAGPGPEAAFVPESGLRVVRRMKRGERAGTSIRYWYDARYFEARRAPGRRHRQGQAAQHGLPGARRGLRAARRDRRGAGRGEVPLPARPHRHGGVPHPVG
nr:hypothetical protein GCM10020092_026800 [Actinoplanes digitatis]